MNPEINNAPPPVTVPSVDFFLVRNASSAAGSGSGSGSSRAEVAYSLLLDGYVTPEGMEYTEKADEFAEQLKAITVQLEEQQNRFVRWSLGGGCAAGNWPCLCSPLLFPCRRVAPVVVFWYDRIG